MFKILLIVALGFAVGYGINTYRQSSITTPKPDVKVVTKVVTNPGIPDEFRVFHDAKRGVTCYYKKYAGTMQGASLSCIPDIHLRISQ